MDCAGGVVDLQRSAADDAWLSHAAGDNGGMRRHASTGGQDGLGRDHAVEVLRRCFDADKDDSFTLVTTQFGFVSVEDDRPGRSAGAGGEARGNDIGRVRWIDHRMEELVELRWLNALDGFSLADESFTDHIDGDIDGRLASPLPSPRLKHEQAAILDRELDVLHVAVMMLEPRGDLVELRVGPVDSGQVGPFPPLAAESELPQRRLHPGH